MIEYGVMWSDGFVAKRDSKERALSHIGEFSTVESPLVLAKRTVTDWKRA